MKPALNTAPEAVRLREAALAFARHDPSASSAERDTHGERLNAKLLSAAVRYADAVRSSTPTTEETDRDE